jgi:steroid delta-isomerase-like uncharacterized protein
MVGLCQWGPASFEPEVENWLRTANSGAFGISYEYDVNGSLNKVLQTPASYIVRERSRKMDNKELVRSYFERGCVQHDPDAAWEMVSEDYTAHNPMQPNFHGGRDAHKEMCKAFAEAVRDTSCTIEDQFSEGDKVVTRWTFSGCQTKDLPEIPSKGKCFNVSGITISRVANGKIAEEWVNMDDFGMRKQLGSS